MGVSSSNSCYGDNSNYSNGFNKSNNNSKNHHNKNENSSSKTYEAPGSPFSCLLCRFARFPQVEGFKLCQLYRVILIQVKASGR